MDIATHRAGRRAGRKRQAQITLSAYEAPTQERLMHALVGGREITVEAYRTAGGETTQLRRQRLVAPLERLWRAGAIDAGQYGAARRYQRDVDLAAICGPGGSVRYAPRMIEGAPTPYLLPIESAADYLARLARAQAAVGSLLRAMLDWVGIEPMGWRDQARQWWPNLSERALRSEFLRRLRIVCSRLRCHYMATP